MRKHPRETWSIHPLVSGIQTRAELDETEKLLIYALKAQHPDIGYNLCDGGEGFSGQQSPRAKALISASLREQHRNHDRMSPEGKIAVGTKNRKHMLGTKQSEATCQKLRENTIRLQAEGLIPKGRPIGYKHSSETLSKLRASAKARAAVCDSIQKAVAASAAKRRGSTHPSYCTPDGIEKMKLSKFLKTVAWG